ncbi:MAG: VWA domain-containing protein [Planctomycetota bacterium]
MLTSKTTRAGRIASLARTLLPVLVVLLGLSRTAAGASVGHLPDTSAMRAFSANLIIPQSRVVRQSTHAGVEIVGIDATVNILEQAATTRLVITLNNPTRVRQEAEILLPVPDGSAIRGFDFDGTGAQPSAQLLNAKEAREIYDRIVAQMKDPALLEFVGCNLIRSSVFPVEPNSTMRVTLTYEHLCQSESGRIEYILPRTENIAYRVPLTLTATLSSRHPISMAYSPSHALETTRVSRREIKVSVSKSAETEPSAFRLCYLPETNGAAATFFACPSDQTDGGHFLIVASLPPIPYPAAQQRELIIVIDKSGSMGGEKMEQAREAARQVIEGLRPGERFNIIAFSNTVERFSAEPVQKNDETIKSARDYIASIQASGGTNIYDALNAALEQPVTSGFLSMVFFLTDGQPTVGQTQEHSIREQTKTNNPSERRVFSFGVGYDVNAPLLDAIASDTRASSTYVLPGENVESKVGDVFKKLKGPTLINPSMRFVDSNGNEQPGLALDILPSRLPDLFDGDQLVILGRYVSKSNGLIAILSGNYLGVKREFKFSFSMNQASLKNAFVSRLWASRKIGELTDEIRRMGATTNPNGATDPRLKELIDSIVALSTEYGILTEYTAFLAREGTDLNDSDNVAAVATDNYVRTAQAKRDGIGAVTQSLNIVASKSQINDNRRNGYYDDSMNRVEIANVQQIGNRAFFQRGNQWIDSRAFTPSTGTSSTASVSPAETVIVGSDAYRALIEKLAASNIEGVTSLSGEIIVVIDGKVICVKPAISEPVK